MLKQETGNYQKILNDPAEISHRNLGPNERNTNPDFEFLFQYFEM